VGIVPSIEMVIFCAVGGRLSIIGAVYGALLVNAAKTSFSESFPELWLFAMGGLFIAVVMAFPNGLAGLYNTYAAPKVDALVDKLFAKKTPLAIASPTIIENPIVTATSTSTKTLTYKIETPTIPEGAIHE
jgi:urea transport system permease protein